MLPFPLGFLPSNRFLDSSSFLGSPIVSWNGIFLLDPRAGFVNGRLEMFDRVAVGQEASSPVERASGSEETLSWSDEAEAPSSENEEELPTAAEHAQGQSQSPAGQPAGAQA